MASGAPLRARDDDSGVLVGRWPSAAQRDGLRPFPEAGPDRRPPASKKLSSKKRIKGEKVRRQRAQRSRGNALLAEDRPTVCDAGPCLLVQINDHQMGVEPRRQPFRDVRPQALECAGSVVRVVEHDPRASLRQSGPRRAADQSEFRPEILTCTAGALVGATRLRPLAMSQGPQRQLARCAPTPAPAAWASAAATRASSPAAHNGAWLNDRPAYRPAPAVRAMPVHRGIGSRTCRGMHA